MGQHAYLAPVMSFVRKHIGNHGGTRRPRRRPTIATELFDAAARVCESFRQHLRASLRALGESGTRLFLGATGAIELHRRLEVWGRKTQPFEANIMDVSEDGGDGASAAARWLFTPGLRVKTFEDELVHRVVGDESFDEDVANLG